MSTLVETAEVIAADVSFTSDTLDVALSDGRTVSVPLAWFPLLLDATPKQRTPTLPLGGGRENSGA